MNLKAQDKGKPKRIYLNILFIAAALTVQSCAWLEQAPSNNRPEVAAVAQTISVIDESPDVDEIPVILGVDSDEQQALIEAINRNGQPLEYSGFAGEIPAPADADASEVVELNYEQADLRLILEELASALDITLVIDPTIDNRISIRTSAERPLQRDDIWPLIQLLTRDAGILIERVGDIYDARKVSSALPSQIRGPDSLTEPGEALVLQVTPLTYVSSDAVIQAIEPLLQPEGSISQLGNRDLLIITASNYVLQRVNQLLMLIDADPFLDQGIHLYQLSNGNATEVAEELSEIIFLIEGPSPSYQVKGIERINSILVTAPAARGFEEISRWVQILDADSQEQVEQLFMYRVKNLDALGLAETLSTVFEEEEEPVLTRIGRDSNSPAPLIAPGDANQVSSLEGEEAPPQALASSSNLSLIHI